jgi:peptide chain release factor 2
MIEETELEMMLSGKYDNNPAILTIHPGAGGTESQDWASMLYRMYTRYCEQAGYKVEVLDYQDGEEAGIKSATIRAVGDYAYGYLKAESGVHRLVRISPFDASKRRHTSFTSVHVVPEIESDDEVEIDEKDLRIDTFRSSGAGGQHVNTTDSAIRITHLPTGIVTSCQNERSQHKNKATAMKVLRSRLAQLKMEEHEREVENSSAAKKDIAWGSQIRSYVMHPYQMVKDHRTSEETSNVTKVMEGGLQNFIRAFLLSSTAQERQEQRAD